MRTNTGTGTETFSVMGADTDIMTEGGINRDRHRDNQNTPKIKH